MKSLRVAQESPDDRNLRLAAQRESREARAAKLGRTRHGGAHDDVTLANSFREVGVDYLSIPRDQVFQRAAVQLEGKRVSAFSEQGIKFLKENFDVEQVEDSEGRILLHFRQRGDEEMNLLSVVAAKAGQKRSAAKTFYEALVEVIQDGLQEDRRVRLPGLGIVKVKFSPAKPKRKGVNPFNGEKMTFKAKPACNKVKFTVAKDLRQFVDKKIKVVAPKKKKG